MPPVALVLATHLLLQQGAWRRQQPQAQPNPGDAVPTGDRQPEQGGIAAAAASGTSEDAAIRERALKLYADAEAAGRKLTGAQLGRAIGRSDRYGRLLLREFRTSGGPGGNGKPPQ
jgi:hypothetical protein